MNARAFVREKLKASYSETGRPSIDPELLLRILLIGYIYDDHVLVCQTHPDSHGENSKKDPTFGGWCWCTIGKQHFVDDLGSDSNGLQWMRFVAVHVLHGHRRRLRLLRQEYRQEIVVFLTAAAC